MATFKEAIETALKSDRMKLLSVNQNLMEVASGTKRKPAFIRSAITEDLAEGLLHRSRVAFILHIDADEMNEIVRNLDEGEGESA